MSKGKSTTTTTTDPAQMEIYQDLYSKAQGIASQPFVPYTGARVAGFNPDQLMGFGATRNMFNQSMGFDPRSQLNNLAYMSAPSVNLPFGYNQPQQPSPIFQPMPITGGGGRRPTPPISIGGPGGGGPVFPSPTPGTGYDPMPKMTMGDGTDRNRPLVGTDLREAGFLNMPEAIFDGPRVSMEEAEASLRAAGGGRGPGYFGDNPEVLAQRQKTRESLIAEGFDPDRPLQAFGSSADPRASRPRGPIVGGNVPGGGGINYGGLLQPPTPPKPIPSQDFGFGPGIRPSEIINSDGTMTGSAGVTVRRPDPIRNPIRPGLQSQTNPFSPTQLGPAAMQQASNIAPVDLYSGASVNRGDVRDITPRSLLDTDIGAYQNPFQSQVIDNTLGDLNRARQMQIQSDQDAAIGRGAFGGSRSALLESETNRNFAEQAGKLASNLRSQGFDRATGLAGQDIDRQFGADRFMSDADRAIAMQNATFGQQAGLARQGLLGDVAQNQARLDASRFAANQDALNRFGLQQGQFNNQMNMGMFDAANRAAFMQPELEMRNRQFQAGLLSDQLSDQYRSLGMLSSIGSQQQGLQQRGMDAGYNEFLRALGYGPQQLGLLAQGVSALPTQSNVSQSYKPGTFEQIGGAAGAIGSIMGLFSDERLKDNITLVGKSKGHNVYTWTWNDVAKKLGINTPEIGVIAQEVAHIPNAVFEHESGYLTVNYGAL